jgi:hypothetical protein
MRVIAMNANTHVAHRRIGSKGNTYLTVILKTAVETPPERSSPSVASVCSKASCHPMGELRSS